LTESVVTATTVVDTVEHPVITYSLNEFLAIADVLDYNIEFLNALTETAEITESLKTPFPILEALEEAFVIAEMLEGQEDLFETAAIADVMTTPFPIKEALTEEVVITEIGKGILVFAEALAENAYISDVVYPKILHYPTQFHVRQTAKEVSLPVANGYKVLMENNGFEISWRLI
jgi:hypothetical protein